MMWVVGQSPTEAAFPIAVRRHYGNIPHVREALVGLLSLPSQIVVQMRDWCHSQRVPPLSNALEPFHLQRGTMRLPHH